MANTPTHGVYYPTSATDVTPLESQFATLASSVDTALTTVKNGVPVELARSGTYTQRTAWTTRPAGSTFWQTNAGGEGIGLYRWNGTAWLYYGAAPSSGTRTGTGAQRASTPSEYWDFWVDTDGSKGMYVGDASGGWRRYSGQTAVAPGAWTAGTSPVVGRTTSVTIPTKILPEEELFIQLRDVGGSFGFAMPANYTRNATDTVVGIRHVQFLNGSQFATAVNWQIVRI